MHRLFLLIILGFTTVVAQAEMQYLYCVNDNDLATMTVIHDKESGDTKEDGEGEGEEEPDCE